MTSTIRNLKFCKSFTKFVLLVFTIIIFWPKFIEKNGQKVLRNLTAFDCELVVWFLMMANEFSWRWGYYNPASWYQRLDHSLRRIFRSTQYICLLRDQSYCKPSGVLPRWLVQEVLHKRGGKIVRNQYYVNNKKIRNNETCKKNYSNELKIIKVKQFKILLNRDLFFTD